MADTNGTGRATEYADIGRYEFESPFIIDPLREAPSSVVEGTAPGRVFGPGGDEASPFMTEYLLEADEAVLNPTAETYASLVSELEDEEFAEAVTDLVNEAAAIIDQTTQREAGDPVRDRVEAERQVRDYLAGVERESIRSLDRLESSLGESNLGALSAGEVESLLERFEPGIAGLTPAAENFIGKLVKKAKKVVSKVTKFLPHNLILGKLKGLVRPLLERVLKFALDKLPASIRPIAAQLAKQFLGVTLPATASAAGAPEPTAATPAAEPASADPAEIQSELDAQLAGYAIGGEAFERQVAMEQQLSEHEGLVGDRLRSLRRCRADFARGVVQLRQGEDPTPHVERFVPAILGALKIGINIIGRPKVVSFLAGLVAKLIAKYVGKEQATTLSRSLVDAGLRMVNLEAVDEMEEAGYTLAATVEDTVNRVARSAPEAAWENETLLDGYVREAFEKAAAAHFPDPLIRSELHEAAAAPGAWVMMPGGGGPKHYKKYTRIDEIVVSPQAAAAVKAFGGATLAALLRDQLKLPLNGPVRARAHLYEAIAGTTLSLISLHEKVPGLASKERTAWSLIQPLTPEAAGLLLKEPGLGKAVDPRFLADPNLIDVGQRLYYLEIVGGVRPLVPGGGRPGSVARTTRISVALDFPRTELRVFLYYSEVDAQSIAQQLRRRAPLSAVTVALRAGLDARLTTLLSGDARRGLRVIHEAVPQEGLTPPPALAAILRVAGPPLAQLLARWLVQVLTREVEQRYDRFAAEFARAADAAVDGVTIGVAFPGLSFLTAMRRMITTGRPPSVADVTRLLLATLGDSKLDIRPGFARW